MLLFKSCPRCWGDLRLDKDRYGVFLTCLQCGYLEDILTDKEEVRPDAIRVPCSYTGYGREDAGMIKSETLRGH